ncbi:phosphatidylglycerophosphatase [Humidesulfovibrio mexicanus]|uniref:Phosphatidylglycerophosphatase n=1 Tax=Humidesulfovibrio mexicanus TaxID=147047 RepID=A0A239D3S0_9BACT|nr:phosphatidylglycerophosphatase [Humidesulfovibrio mexicanus]
MAEARSRPSGGGGLAVAVATLGPVGRMPGAPGTWGSLAALLAAPWCFTPLPIGARVGVLCLVLVLGAWTAGRAEKALGGKDPGCVVVDELLGQWTAFAPFHLAGWTRAMPLEMLALFVLFRIFDILKPWPIRQVERTVPGGFGIMLDDLLAGLLAAGAYALLRPLV